MSKEICIKEGIYRYQGVGVTILYSREDGYCFGFQKEIGREQIEYLTKSLNEIMNQENNTANVFITKSLHGDTEHSIILSDDVIEFLKTFALVTHTHDKSNRWTETFTINQTYFKRSHDEQ